MMKVSIVFYVLYLVWISIGVGPQTTLSPILLGPLKFPWPMNGPLNKCIKYLFLLGKKNKGHKGVFDTLIVNVRRNYSFFFLREK